MPLLITFPSGVSEKMFKVNCWRMTHNGQQLTLGQTQGPRSAVSTAVIRRQSPSQNVSFFPLWNTHRWGDKKNAVWTLNMLSQTVRPLFLQGLHDHHAVRHKTYIAHPPLRGPRLSIILSTTLNQLLQSLNLTNFTLFYLSWTTPFLQQTFKVCPMGYRGLVPWGVIVERVHCVSQ